jgi:single-stranded DNA-binding protein
MGYFKNGNKMLIWGTAARDASVKTTKSGKNVCGFAVKYDWHHDENGKPVNEFMEVSMWGDDALFVGHESIGVAKGDKVLVCGEMTKDTFYKQGEDRSKPKYKINADFVLDMTTIFQITQMVAGGGAEEEPAPQPPREKPRSAKVQQDFQDLGGPRDPFTSITDEEDDPFSDDGELPY